jgi:ribonuclease J
VTSGSQGEPFSALYRLALAEHPDLSLSPGDLVVFSARVVPGHERSVNRVCDHLVRRGARVLTESDPPVHVSGHAHRDELREWLDVARPRAVLPVHGERRMLAAAAEVAREAGVAGENIPLLDNGDRLTIEEGAVSVARGAVASGRIYLDSRPEPVDSGIVRDRRELAEEGVIVVIVPADAGEEVVVASRGVAVPADRLAEEIRRAARGVIERATREEREDPEWLRAEVALAARRACRRAFGLRPVIVPVVA